MPDQRLTCVDCKAGFVFTARDQEFYKSKAFQDPKRCPDCRAEKKRRMQKEEIDRARERT